MMIDVYKDFLITYMSEHANIKSDSLDIESNVFESEYIDSFGIFSLLVAIEEEFDIQISIESLFELDNITISNLSQLLESKKNR